MVSVVDYSSVWDEFVFVEEDGFFVEGYEEVDGVCLAVDFFGVGSDGVEVVSSSDEGLVVVGAEDVQSSP